MYLPMSFYAITKRPNSGSSIVLKISITHSNANVLIAQSKRLQRNSFGTCLLSIVASSTLQLTKFTRKFSQPIQIVQLGVHAEQLLLQSFFSSLFLIFYEFENFVFYQPLICDKSLFQNTITSCFIFSLTDVFCRDIFFVFLVTVLIVTLASFSICISFCVPLLTYFQITLDDMTNNFEPGRTNKKPVISRDCN